MRAFALLLVVLLPALTACSGEDDAAPGAAQNVSQEEDEAVDSVERAADPLDLVCGPGAELTSEDALRAELACAHR